MTTQDTVKVSVIVPIYNEEVHIINLIEQLKNQDFKNAEFLLINDGSTDNTLAKMTTYLKNNPDKRFKILTKNNNGVSSARNLGLAKAKGEYIMFKDADDLCTSDYVSSYYKAIEKRKTDIVFFGLKRLSSTLKPVDWPEMKALKIKEKVNAHRLLKIYAKQELRGYSVTYISKRKLWENVSFNENLVYQEDSLALLELIINNPSLTACMNESSYYYYVNNPLSTTRNVNAKIYWQAVFVDNKIINEMAKNEYFIDLIPEMHSHNLTNYSTLIGFCLINNDLQNYKMARKEYLSSYKAARVSNELKLKRYIQFLLFKFNNKALLRMIYKNIMRTD